MLFTCRVRFCPSLMKLKLKTVTIVLVAQQIRCVRFRIRYHGSYFLCFWINDVQLQTCQGFHCMYMPKMNWLWTTCMINKRPLIVGKHIQSLVSGKMLNANVKIKQDYNADALRTLVLHFSSDHKNATPLKSWVLVTTGPQYPNLGKILWL